MTMGLKLDKTRKNPAQFLSLTGFTPNEFDELLLGFRNEWEDYSNHFTLGGKPRQRIALPRKTNVLPGVQDKLLFILVYLKTFPLQELQAATFSMTQPQANFWIHLLSPILRKTLKRLRELPERNSQKLEQLLKDCADVLLDGVERSIQRPLNPEQQQDCYSGKKNA
jgi:hypothetical protein